MGKLKWKILLVVTISFVLFGCQKMNQFTPQEVIKNVLVSDDEISYYAEFELKLFENGEEQLEMQVKEWRENERQRVEIEADDENVVSVNDGLEIIVYDENEQSAYVMNDIDIENLYINPKEQLDMLLDMIKDTHDIEIIGDEEILGRKTFHLVAEQKEDTNSLLGDQELWIDKEYWMVLKMKSMSGDNVSNLKYNKIQFNPKLEDSTFQLDLPEGVVVENLTNQVDQEEITINDLSAKMDTDVLYIPDEENHQIETITFTETAEPFSYKDVTIDYKKQGLPLMTLTILYMDEEDPYNDEMDEEELEELDVFDESFQKEIVRGEEGHYLEFDGIRSLSWDEAGLSYSIDIIDANVTLEEILEWTEKMEHPE